MFKRLSGATGEIADNQVKPDDTPEKIVRSAILIHSAANGGETTLASSDGDISFDEKRIRNVVDNHNKMISGLAVQYGGFSKMPIGAYPPILDQHSDDSNDRIRGRLTGLLRFEKRSVPKVGDNVACAVCDITFLGRDTVSQVLDGRIYHLSVGIDEASDTLGETSTVIEPAAPGAMVLKKRKVIQVKLKKSKGVKVSKLKIAKLKKAVAQMKTLSKNATALKKTVSLAKRKVEVKGRFVKLMADKKMSPAEFRKVDLTKLAKLDKESINHVIGAYEGREVLVKSGQQGTTSAANFTDVGTSEDREVKRLKAATKKNLSKMGLKFKDDDDKKDLEADDKEVDKKDLSLDDEQGDAGTDVDEPQDESGNDNEEMMQQIEENAAQIARVASMVEQIISEMGDEGDDESASDDADDDDASEMAKGDDEDDKKKDLADDDKKDDDKKDLEKDKEEKDDKKEESK